MKKILFALLALFSISTLSATNSSSSSEQYYIQGVSSSQDIGGVEASIKGNDDPDLYANPYMKRICFKNYRDYAVQVYYEFTYGHPKSSKPERYAEGSIILDAKETKYLEMKYNSARDIRVIVRRL